QALPQPDAGRVRDRDSPGLRAGGFRSSVLARTEGAGSTPSGRGGEAEEVMMQQGIAELLASTLTHPATKEQDSMQKITTHLWFDNQAEEAARFYVSLFKNSKILNVARYGEAGAKVSGRQPGSIMTVTFQLDGQQFIALNGGPLFKFSDAISFLVNCETQAEVDELWEKLSEGGEKGPCGWLKDKYGLSWQIVPTVLGEMLQDKEPKKSEPVMAALLQMKKLDIAG